jgi:anthranilate phosphoribosyltransferase
MSARRDMETTIGAMLDGAMQPVDAIAILTAMEGKTTPEQLAGAVDAVMARAVTFPAFPHAVDCCGTGGDGQHTLNISTAAAIVVAACGVMVAKHGNRAVTSKSGSADVLEALGVKTNLVPARAAEILTEIGICFLFAPTFHPGFAQVAEIRKTIGTRTVFNLLGPLCNPARIKRQLIGTFSQESAELVAHTTKLLGRDHVMVVHGEDGSDEISIAGETLVWELKDGQLRHYTVEAPDAGLEPHAKAGLKGGDAARNAHALRDVLDGETSTYFDAVLLNAAAVLQVAGKAATLKEGTSIAREAIRSGAAHAKLGALVEATNA